MNILNNKQNENNPCAGCGEPNPAMGNPDSDGWRRDPTNDDTAHFNAGGENNPEDYGGAEDAGFEGDVTQIDTYNAHQTPALIASRINAMIGNFVVRKIFA